MNKRSQFDVALAQLREVVEDGLRHGFFEYSVTCEVIAQKKRRLVIKAGISHQFTIPEEELPGHQGPDGRFRDS